MPLFDVLSQQLQSREPLPPLVPPGAWQAEITQQIESADDAALFGSSSPSSTRTAACRAGLLLWNDDLDASHTISQGIEDSTGSYWHAIMHRREGDYSNSNYWWRRTGNHAAFVPVYAAALAELQDETGGAAQQFRQSLERAGKWQPEEFVAACEAARGDDLWLRRVQAAEMKVLLDWCCSQR